MTPVFSWSECVISRVLSCVYLLEGGAPFLCFCCVRSSCLAERCYFSSFGLVLGGSGQDRVFFMTLFFCILESWTFGVSCWMLVFLEFWAGFERSWSCSLCVLRFCFLVLKLWSFVAAIHGCRRRW